MVARARAWEPRRPRSAVLGQGCPGRAQLDDEVDRWTRATEKAQERRTAFTVLTDWKKIKVILFLDMWKVREVQVSASPNGVLLAQTPARAGTAAARGVVTREAGVHLPPLTDKVH